MVRETRYLIVRNLPENCTEETIIVHFQRYGKIQSVKLQKDNDADNTATVAFNDIKSAAKAHNAKNSIGQVTLRTDYWEGSTGTPVLANTPVAGSSSVRSSTYSSASTPASRLVSTFPTWSKGTSDEDGSNTHDKVDISQTSVPGINTFVTASAALDKLSSTAFDLQRGRGRERIKQKKFGQKFEKSGSFGRHGTTTSTRSLEAARSQSEAAAAAAAAVALSLSATPATTSASSSSSGNISGLNPIIVSDSKDMSSRDLKESRRESASRSRPHSVASPSSRNSGVNRLNSHSRSVSHSRSRSRGSRSSSCRSRSSGTSQSTSPHRSHTSSTTRPQSMVGTSRLVNSEVKEAKRDDNDGDRRPLGICVTALPMRSTDSSLRDGLYHEYKKHGKVTTVQICGDGESRCAVISFRKPEDASKALEASQGKVFFGSKVKVSSHEGVEVDDTDRGNEIDSLDEYHVKSTRTLFVGNLEKETTTQDLIDKFKQFGDIIDVDIKRQGASTAFAFVQYADIASVVSALRAMEGEHIGINKIKLGFGKSMPTSCVWMDCLPTDSNNRLLRTAMARYGEVTYCCVDRNRNKGLVYFTSYEDAQRCVNDIKMRPHIMKKKLQIDFASRECQTDFLDRMETSGQLRANERPDESRVHKFRQQRSFDSFQEDGSPSTYGFSRTSSSFTARNGRSSSGSTSYRRGRQCADGTFTEENHTGSRRSRRQEEFNQTGQFYSAKGSTDDYDAVLREYGHSQRERRERDVSPRPSVDRRVDSQSRQNSRDHSLDRYDKDRTVEIYNSRDTSPGSDRNSYHSGSRHRSSRDEKYSSREHYEDSKAEDNDHHIRVSRNTSPHIHSRSLSHDSDYEHRGGSRSQSPPTPIQEDSSIHRIYYSDDCKRSTEITDDYSTYTATHKQKDLDEISSKAKSLLIHSSKLGAEVIKTAGKSRKRTHEESGLSDLGKIDAKLLRKSDKSVLVSEKGKVLSEKEKKLNYEASRQMLKGRERASSPGSSASHGDSENGSVSEGDLHHLHQEKHHILRKLRELNEEVVGTSEPDSPRSVAKVKSVAVKEALRLSGRSHEDRKGEEGLVKVDAHRRTGAKVRGLDSRRESRNHLNEDVNSVREDKSLIDEKEGSFGGHSDSDCGSGFRRTKKRRTDPSVDIVSVKDKGYRRAGSVDVSEDEDLDRKSDHSFRIHSSSVVKRVSCDSRVGPKLYSEPNKAVEVSSSDSGDLFKDGLSDQDLSVIKQTKSVSKSNIFFPNRTWNERSPVVCFSPAYSEEHTQDSVTSGSLTEKSSKHLSSSPWQHSPPASPTGKDNSDGDYGYYKDFTIPGSTSPDDCLSDDSMGGDLLQPPPGEPSVEERIRAIDEMLNMTTSNKSSDPSLLISVLSNKDIANNNDNTALYSKFRIRKRESVLDGGNGRLLTERTTEPSVIMQQVLSKKSILDQDFKRLEQMSEIYDLGSATKELSSLLKSEVVSPKLIDLKGDLYLKPLLSPSLLSSSSTHPVTTSSSMLQPTITTSLAGSSSSFAVLSASVLTTSAVSTPVTTCSIHTSSRPAAVDNSKRPQGKCSENFEEVSDRHTVCTNSLTLKQDVIVVSSVPVFSNNSLSSSLSLTSSSSLPLTSSFTLASSLSPSLSSSIAGPGLKESTTSSVSQLSCKFFASPSSLPSSLLSTSASSTFSISVPSAIHPKTKLQQSVLISPYVSSLSPSPLSATQSTSGALVAAPFTQGPDKSQLTPTVGQEAPRLCSPSFTPENSRTSMSSHISGSRSPGVSTHTANKDDPHKVNSEMDLKVNIFNEADSKTDELKTNSVTPDIESPISVQSETSSVASVPLSSIDSKANPHIDDKISVIPSIVSPTIPLHSGLNSFLKSSDSVKIETLSPELVSEKTIGQIIGMGSGNANKKCNEPHEAAEVLVSRKTELSQAVLTQTVMSISSTENPDKELSYVADISNSSKVQPGTCSSTTLNVDTHISPALKVVPASTAATPSSSIPGALLPRSSFDKSEKKTSTKLNTSHSKMSSGSAKSEALFAPDVKMEHTAKSNDTKTDVRHHSAKGTPNKSNSSDKKPAKQATKDAHEHKDISSSKDLDKRSESSAQDSVKKESNKTKDKRDQSKESEKSKLKDKEETKKKGERKVSEKKVEKKSLAVKEEKKVDKKEDKKDRSSEKLKDSAKPAQTKHSKLDTTGSKQDKKQKEKAKVVNSKDKEKPGDKKLLTNLSCVAKVGPTPESKQESKTATKTDTKDSKSSKNDSTSKDSATKDSAAKDSSVKDTTVKDTAVKPEKESAKKTETAVKGEQKTIKHKADSKGASRAGSEAKGDNKEAQPTTASTKRASESSKPKKELENEGTKQSLVKQSDKLLKLKQREEEKLKERRKLKEEKDRQKEREEKEKEERDKQKEKEKEEREKREQEEKERKEKEEKERLKEEKERQKEKEREEKERKEKEKEERERQKEKEREERERQKEKEREEKERKEKEKEERERQKEKEREEKERQKEREREEKERKDKEREERERQKEKEREERERQKEKEKEEKERQKEREKEERERQREKEREEKEKLKEKEKEEKEKKEKEEKERIKKEKTEREKQKQKERDEKESQKEKDKLDKKSKEKEEKQKEKEKKEKEKKERKPEKKEKGKIVKDGKVKKEKEDRGKKEKDEKTKPDKVDKDKSNKEKEKADKEDKKKPAPKKPKRNELAALLEHNDMIQMSFTSMYDRVKTQRNREPDLPHKSEPATKSSFDKFKQNRKKNGSKMRSSLYSFDTSSDASDDDPLSDLSEPEPIQKTEPVKEAKVKKTKQIKRPHVSSSSSSSCEEDDDALLRASKLKDKKTDKFSEIFSSDSEDDNFQAPSSKLKAMTKSKVKPVPKRRKNRDDSSDSMASRDDFVKPQAFSSVTDSLDDMDISEEDDIKTKRKKTKVKPSKSIEHEERDSSIESVTKKTVKLDTDSSVESLLPKKVLKVDKEGSLARKSKPDSKKATKAHESKAGKDDSKSAVSEKKKGKSESEKADNKAETSSKSESRKPKSKVESDKTGRKSISKADSEKPKSKTESQNKLDPEKSKSKVESDTKAKGETVTGLDTEKHRPKDDEKHKASDDKVKPKDEEKHKVSEDKAKPKDEEKHKVSEDKVKPKDEERHKVSEDKVKPKDEEKHKTNDDKVKPKDDEKHKSNDDKVKPKDDERHKTNDDKVKPKDDERHKTNDDKVKPKDDERHKTNDDKVKPKDDERHKTNDDKVKPKDDERHKTNDDKVKPKDDERHKTNDDKVKPKDDEKHKANDDKVKPKDDEKHKVSDDKVKPKDDEKHKVSDDKIKPKDDEKHKTNDDKSKPKDDDKHKGNDDKVKPKDDEKHKVIEDKVKSKDDERHKTKNEERLKTKDEEKIRFRDDDKHKLKGDPGSKYEQEKTKAKAELENKSDAEKGKSKLETEPEKHPCKGEVGSKVDLDKAKAKAESGNKAEKARASIEVESKSDIEKPRSKNELDSKHQEEKVKLKDKLFSDSKSTSLAERKKKNEDKEEPSLKKKKKKKYDPLIEEELVNSLITKVYDKVERDKKDKKRTKMSIFDSEPEDMLQSDTSSGILSSHDEKPSARDVDEMETDRSKEDKVDSSKDNIKQDKHVDTKLSIDDASLASKKKHKKKKDKKDEQKEPAVKPKELIKKSQVETKEKKKLDMDLKAEKVPKIEDHSEDEHLKPPKKKKKKKEHGRDPDKEKEKPTKVGKSPQKKSDAEKSHTSGDEKECSHSSEDKSASQIVDEFTSFWGHPKPILIPKRLKDSKKSDDEKSKHKDDSKSEASSDRAEASDKVKEEPCYGKDEKLSGIDDKLLDVSPGLGKTPDSATTPKMESEASDDFVVPISEAETTVTTEISSSVCESVSSIGGDSLVIQEETVSGEEMAIIPDETTVGSSIEIDDDDFPSLIIDEIPEKSEKKAVKKDKKLLKKQQDKERNDHMDEVIASVAMAFSSDDEDDQTSLLIETDRPDQELLLSDVINQELKYGSKMPSEHERKSGSIFSDILFPDKDKKEKLPNITSPIGGVQKVRDTKLSSSPTKKESDKKKDIHKIFGPLDEETKKRDEELLKTLAVLCDPNVDKPVVIEDIKHEPTEEEIRQKEELEKKRVEEERKKAEEEEKTRREKEEQAMKEASDEAARAVESLLEFQSGYDQESVDMDDDLPPLFIEPADKEPPVETAPVSPVESKSDIVSIFSSPIPDKVTTNLDDKLLEKKPDKKGPADQADIIKLDPFNLFATPAQTVTPPQVFTPPRNSSVAVREKTPEPITLTSPQRQIPLSPQMHSPHRLQFPARPLQSPQHQTQSPQRPLMSPQIDMQSPQPLLQSPQRPPFMSKDSKIDSSFMVTSTDVPSIPLDMDVPKGQQPQRRVSTGLTAQPILDQPLRPTQVSPRRKSQEFSSELLILSSRRKTISVPEEAAASVTHLDRRFPPLLGSDMIFSKERTHINSSLPPPVSISLDHAPHDSNSQSPMQSLTIPPHQDSILLSPKKVSPGLQFKERTPDTPIFPPVPNKTTLQETLPHFPKGPIHDQMFVQYPIVATQEQIFCVTKSPVSEFFKVNKNTTEPQTLLHSKNTAQEKPAQNKLPEPVLVPQKNAAQELLLQHAKGQQHMLEHIPQHDKSLLMREPLFSPKVQADNPFNYPDQNIDFLLNSPPRNNLGFSSFPPCPEANIPPVTKQPDYSQDPLFIAVSEVSARPTDKDPSHPRRNEGFPASFYQEPVPGPKTHQETVTISLQQNFEDDKKGARKRKRSNKKTTNEDRAAALAEQQAIEESVQANVDSIRKALNANQAKAAAEKASMVGTDKKKTLDAYDFEAHIGQDMGGNIGVLAAETAYPSYGETDAKPLRSRNERGRGRGYGTRRGRRGRGSISSVHEASDALQRTDPSNHPPSHFPSRVPGQDPLQSHLQQHFHRQQFSPSPQQQPAFQRQATTQPNQVSRPLPHFYQHSHTSPMSSENSSSLSAHDWQQKQVPHSYQHNQVQHQPLLQSQAKLPVSKSDVLSPESNRQDLDLSYGESELIINLDDQPSSTEGKENQYNLSSDGEERGLVPSPTTPTKSQRSTRARKQPDYKAIASGNVHTPVQSRSARSGGSPRGLGNGAQSPKNMSPRTRSTENMSSTPVVKLEKLEVGRTTRSRREAATGKVYGKDNVSDAVTPVASSDDQKIKTAIDDSRPVSKENIYEFVDNEHDQPLENSLRSVRARKKRASDNQSQDIQLQQPMPDYMPGSPTTSSSNSSLFVQEPKHPFETHVPEVKPAEDSIKPAIAVAMSNVDAIIEAVSKGNFGGSLEEDHSLDVPTPAVSEPEPVPAPPPTRSSRRSTEIKKEAELKEKAEKTFIIAEPPRFEGKEGGRKGPTVPPLRIKVAHGTKVEKSEEKHYVIERSKGASSEHDNPPLAFTVKLSDSGTATIKPAGATGNSTPSTPVSATGNKNPTFAPGEVYKNDNVHKKDNSLGLFSGLPQNEQQNNEQDLKFNIPNSQAQPWKTVDTITDETSTTRSIGAMHPKVAAKVQASQESQNVTAQVQTSVPQLIQQYPPSSTPTSSMPSLSKSSPVTPATPQVLKHSWCSGLKQDAPQHQTSSSEQTLPSSYLPTYIQNVSQMPPALSREAQIHQQPTQSVHQETKQPPNAHSQPVLHPDRPGKLNKPLVIEINAADRGAPKLTAETQKHHQGPFGFPPHVPPAHSGQRAFIMPSEQPGHHSNHFPNSSLLKSTSDSRPSKSPSIQPQPAPKIGPEVRTQTPPVTSGSMLYAGVVSGQPHLLSPTSASPEGQMIERIQNPIRQPEVSQAQPTISLHLPGSHHQDPTPRFIKDDVGQDGSAPMIGHNERTPSREMAMFQHLIEQQRLEQQRLQQHLLMAEAARTAAQEAARNSAPDPSRNIAANIAMRNALESSRNTPVTLEGGRKGPLPQSQPVGHGQPLNLTPQSDNRGGQTDSSRVTPKSTPPAPQSPFSMPYFDRKGDTGRLSATVPGSFMQPSPGGHREGLPSHLYPELSLANLTAHSPYMVGRLPIDPRIYSTGQQPPPHLMRDGVLPGSFSQAFPPGARFPVLEHSDGKKGDSGHPEQPAPHMLRSPSPIQRQLQADALRQQLTRMPCDLPTRDSPVGFLQRYPVMWQGALALKNDNSYVQMHFIAGNRRLPNQALPQPMQNGALPPLRISQRMRLEHAQLEGVAKRMQCEDHYCILIAVACGRDQMDINQQTRALNEGFITYLLSKQAAGIVNVPLPGSEQVRFVVHIFPPCEFVDNSVAQQGSVILMEQLREVPHAVIIIATT